MDTSNFHQSLIKVSVCLLVCLAANTQVLAESAIKCVENPDGSVTETSSCVECAESTTKTFFVSECNSNGILAYSCCNGSNGGGTVCFEAPPPGMICVKGSPGQPGSKAKFESGQPKEKSCEGPTAADPNGWSTTFTDINGISSTKTAQCDPVTNTMYGTCCDSSSPGGALNSYTMCSAVCPMGFVCSADTKGCIPGAPIKCTGQTKASADGVYSLTLSTNPPITLKSTDTNGGKSYCNIGDSKKAYIAQPCCKHDNKTGNDYIGQCWDFCEDLIPNSCCIEGKCVAKPKCGNGIVEGDEKCDDGNLINGDGCNANCTVEKPAPFCGDKVLNQTGEQCDPPDGTTCDKNCQTLPFCGNGTIEPGEQCEPPNTATCSATCTHFPTCGNGAQDPGEQCDDGNLIDGDGCDKTCRDEPKKPIPFCGNGKVELGEMCDDGNTLDGDGCSALCTIPIEIPKWPTGSSNGTIINDGTFLPPIIILPSPDKTPIVFPLTIWNQLIKIITLTTGCSTTAAADGSTWSTTSTNIFSTMNYTPACKDGTTLTGFVCVDNKLVTQSKTCTEGATCKNGKCAK